MKFFIIALFFIGCTVSFSHADDGWAEDYVQSYNEFLSVIDEAKANVEGEAAKQAVQKVHDDVKDLFMWLTQRDGEQVPITVSRLINDLDALASQLNEEPEIQNLVREDSAKLKELRDKPIPLAQYAEELNKLMEESKNKLIDILGGGC